MDLITVIRVSGRLVHDHRVLASGHEDLEIQVGQGYVIGDARNFSYGGCSSGSSTERSSILYRHATKSHFFDETNLAFSPSSTSWNTGHPLTACVQWSLP